LSEPARSFQHFIPGKRVGSFVAFPTLSARRGDRILVYLVGSGVQQEVTFVREEATFRISGGVGAVNVDVTMAREIISAAGAHDGILKRYVEQATGVANALPEDVERAREAVAATDSAAERYAALSGAVVIEHNGREDVISWDDLVAVEMVEPRLQASDQPAALFA
jgi:hypothetical protein